MWSSSFFSVSVRENFKRLEFDNLFHNENRGEKWKQKRRRNKPIVREIGFVEQVCENIGWQMEKRRGGNDAAGDRSCSEMKLVVDVWRDTENVYGDRATELVSSRITTCIYICVYNHFYTLSIPGTIATVFKARRTRNVLRAARLPRSMPIVT